MELTIKIEQIKDDDVHIVADIYKDGEFFGRRVYDKLQIVNEADDAEYEARKSVREYLIANDAKTAVEMKTDIDKTVLTLRG